jgi:CRISPR-associated protein Cas5t
MALKVIKMVGYMGTARFPYGFSLFPEILPLPPFSTISGMVHHACGWERYHPLNFFVSGKGFFNQETQKIWEGGYNFGKITDEQRKRWHIIVENNGKCVGWVQDIKEINFLSDLNLEIYIQPQDEDFQQVFAALKHPKTFLSLGRYEDLIRVDDIVVVELEKKNKIGFLRNNAYIPEQFIDNKIASIAYLINKKYEYTKKGFRRFEKIRCRYLDKGTKVFAELYDGETPVFLS